MGNWLGACLGPVFCAEDRKTLLLPGSEIRRDEAIRQGDVVGKNENTTALSPGCCRGNFASIDKEERTHFYVNDASIAVASIDS